MNEFEKFAPTMKICVLHGSKEERLALLENSEEYDVILDTYKGLNFMQYKIYPHYNKVNEEMEGKIKSYELDNNEKITRLNDGEIIKIRYTMN